MLTQIWQSTRLKVKSVQNFPCMNLTEKIKIFKCDGNALMERYDGDIHKWERIVELGRLITKFTFYMKFSRKFHQNTSSGYEICLNCVSTE